MPRSPEEAIARVRRAARDADEPFAAGLCKQKCREAYEVPSDGSQDAAQAWSRTKRRHAGWGFDNAPRGALLWWTGGSDGHGHVAINDGAGLCWSTDFRRPGHWDRIPASAIAISWRLKYVGWSEDIDGVDVLKSRGAHVDRAERELELVIDNHGHEDKGDYARRLLRALRKWPPR